MAATSGARLDPEMPTKEEVFEALRQVEDPELGMDIVELGLLYDVEVEGPSVKVTYTLTSMGCPAGQMIEEDIDRCVRELPGVDEVKPELLLKLRDALRLVDGLIEGILEERAQRAE